MTFHNLNLWFPDADAFAAWLADKPKPTWAKAGTYHNTYRPDERSWAGRLSMRSMQKTYEGYGWDRGPHCYLAAGTAFDGIWVMTEPWLQGIHAGDCNNDRFGLEVVGDFQSKPMTQFQIALLTSTAAALHRWAGLPADINSHRDCMAKRTCPGDAAYAQRPVIQARLAAALGAPYTADSPILGTDPTSLDRIASVILSRPTGEYTERDLRTSIIPAYLSLCAPVGVNPVLAIAQMLHETGNLTSFWAARPRRNSAGIGVNGQVRYHEPLTPNWAKNGNHWEMGISFKDWVKESIPAHIGRLLAYALTDEQATDNQYAVIHEALEVRPLPPSYRGCAPTIRGLNGTWAVPGLTYATKLAAYANRLVGAV